MRIGALLVGLGLIGSTELVRRQTDPSAAESSIVIGSSASEPLQPIVYPSQGPDASLTDPVPDTGPATAFREGVLLRRRSGEFSRSADGKAWLFKPDDSTNILTILPNQQLAAMEESSRQQPADRPARFTISGAVTTYKNDDYLLVEVAALPNADEAALAADKTEAGGAAPASQPSAPLPADQMLKQMLQTPAGTTGRALRPTTSRAPDRTSGVNAVAPGAASLNVLREGTFLVDRTGRLTRGADGQSWEFTFESDGKALKDAPVLILPNLKLMLMEQAVKGSNRDPIFRITGMVTEYSGRNYVLLEKFVVIPQSAQQF